MPSRATFLIVPSLALAAFTVYSMSLSGQERTTAARGDSLTDQFRPGERVRVSETTHGYRIMLAGEGEGQEIADPSLEIQARYARKQQEVARAELESALSANQRVPSTFTEQQLQRLRLEADRTALQVENILSAAQGHGPYEVRQVGRDYVALRRDGREFLIPLQSVSIVIRPPRE